MRSSLGFESLLGYHILLLKVLIYLETFAIHALHKIENAFILLQVFFAFFSDFERFSFLY